jgi:PBP1b-binding outer membrane lipoprotein LpoB
MRRAVLLLLFLVLALAGCGTQSTPTSVDNFKDPEQRAVAQKVEDLEDAGKSGKPEDICSNILSKDLVSQLDSAGTDCKTEMQKAIDDANEFDLEVRKVTVNGTTATAEVQRGKHGPSETMAFARENGQWRATSLSERR